MSHDAAARPHIVGEAIQPPTGADWQARLDRWLFFQVRESGLPLSAPAAMIAIVGSSLLAGGLCFVIYENELVAAVVAAVVAIVVTLGGFILASIRRQQTLGILPRWIEMLARSLSVGQGLAHALRSSLPKLSGSFAADVRRSADLLDLGLPVDEALRDLGARHQSLELQMTLSALAMHSQTGGDLVAALRRLALVAQQRLDYRRQSQAASSTARFAAICLAIAPPAIFAYYWYTGQFVDRLLNDPTGQFALGLAVVLELIGIVWLSYLSQTEV
ncbi:type II secretion system F family protein [Anatilimnocola floriformis]|uniref:type II secretion system F family protein n=1 Tax=Anatilimnocola floriformis TaxID=2948575 RepID=UPI0020C1D126|nr:type II secretion system F family protein [Anatilimnocola floriformis]